MGVNMYWIIVAIVIILGYIMPQNGQDKKYYIILMASLHTFVCGFRYQYITGDLIKYSNVYRYYSLNPNLSWFSKTVFNNGRNAGFEWVKKFFAVMSNGNFQLFLFVLALFAEVTLAILIYKYSPKPWISYLVWNCMSFYMTYDFAAIKQGLAMSILVLAMICIMEKKPYYFVVLTLIAGFVHMPALAFLPAYWLMNYKTNSRSVILYAVPAGLVFIFRQRLVIFMQDIYYSGDGDVDFTSQSSNVGGRFAVILLICITGFLLKGLHEQDFAGLFNIILTAALLQMFSSYDNVFTRFADYYLQFLVLFIPMIFYDIDYKPVKHDKSHIPILWFDDRSIELLVMILTVILIWWYWRTNLGATVTSEVDNLLNFRFMWDVVN